MALVIRLQRVGKHKQPYFRMVAIEKTHGSRGKPVEILGSYNPRMEKPIQKIQVNRDRIDYWVSQGAKPSETVSTLLKAAGLSAPAPAAKPEPAVKAPAKHAAKAKKA